MPEDPYTTYPNARCDIDLVFDYTKKMLVALGSSAFSLAMCDGREEVIILIMLSIGLPGSATKPTP
eukprot:4311682-Amphidinium_carterae.2